MRYKTRAQNFIFSLKNPSHLLYACSLRARKEFARRSRRAAGSLQLPCGELARSLRGALAGSFQRACGYLVGELAGRACSLLGAFWAFAGGFRGACGELEGSFQGACWEIAGGAGTLQKPCREPLGSLALQPAFASLKLVCCGELAETLLGPQEDLWGSLRGTCLERTQELALVCKSENRPVNAFDIGKYANRVRKVFCERHAGEWRRNRARPSWMCRLLS